MKNVIKAALVCASLASTSAYAASISGTLNIGGAFSVSGGTDLSNATDIAIGTVFPTYWDGNIMIVGMGAGGSTSLDAFTPVADFISISGYDLDLDTLNVVQQDANVLNLSGTGTLSKDGFDDTAADWTLSAQSETSYSMSITAVPTAVPVPAAVWLMGTGLLGLVGVARRKAA